MEKAEVEKGASSEDTSQLSRNRSFKSKQLVRSQAIRESQSPPRTVSPSGVVDPVDIKDDANVKTYDADVKTYGANVKTYDANVKTYDANVETYDANVKTYDANVKTYDANVKTYDADVKTYGARVKSYDANVKTYDASVKTYDANVKGDQSSQIEDTVPSGVYRASDDDRDCADECKKQQVEIQITSGQWDEPPSEQRQRTKRWLGHRQHSRDLLSNNPRVACVCGACCNSACPHCRGRRRRHPCPTKQDSGIVCSDDCPDCSDSEPAAPDRGSDGRTGSLDADDQTVYCRCPDRKEKPKSISLSRTDSEEKSDPTGPELVNFLKETLNKNARDRMTLLKIEKELHALVSDPGRCIVRFPVMTSYGRMLVHRCAALFQLCHHLDQTNKTCVLVSKSGTSGGRIPCTSFRAWCTVVFPAAAPRHAPDAHDPHHAKSILKRDTHSLDEPGSGALSAARSKSLEQREREYERVRRRIFSSDNCSQDESQWQWLNSGNVKVLTPEGGRNKLLKVQSLEGAAGAAGAGRGAGRGAVAKSHSFGGYAPAPRHDQPRLLSRQGDLASSSWRLSPSSSGYRTLSLHSTDSVTPSPTGGASPEPAGGAAAGGEPVRVVWAVTDLSAVPCGALVIHPQTGRPLTNPDGSVYHFDPNNPPVFDNVFVTTDAKVDVNSEKKRGKLEKQHSFIDSEGECRQSEECRGKCCCECRRHDTCHKNTQDKNPTQTDQKHQKPTSPCHSRYEAPLEPPTNQNAALESPTNHRQAYDATANQKPPDELPTNQSHSYNPSPNQRPVYEPHRYEAANQKERFEIQRPPSYEASSKFELANQRPPSELANHRAMQLANQGTPEMQYVAQQYPHGQQYAHEEVTSPQQIGPPMYIPQEMVAQAMAQMKPMQIADPNLRAMPLGLVYGGVQYPYPLYPPPPPAPEEHKQLAMPPHPENTFRIDPSYACAGADYSACGACARPPDPAHYPLTYGDGMQWAGVGAAVGAVGGVGAAVGGVGAVGAMAAPKLFVPEVWYNVPTLYPHYNLVYPQQVMPQYPVCQPAPPDRREQRRGSQHHSKRNSISGSSRNTPLQTTPDDKKVPYEEPQAHPHPHTPIPPHPHPQTTPTPQHPPKDPNEIAAKIQQIKDQMASINVRERDANSRGREERGRRNSGHGILGSYPHSQYNGRFVARPPANDEIQLSSAARAIVNSIRNMQAKNNNYHQDRREYNQNNQYRGDKDREWRRRDDKDRDRDERRPPFHYPRDYFLRQY